MKMETAIETPRAAPIQSSTCGGIKMVEDYPDFRARSTTWAGKFQRTKGKRMAKMETAWQPIETAPKDVTGARFLAYSAAAAWMDIANVGWTEADGRIVYVNDDGFAIGQPTHWMPLPQPPEATP
jgi:hypothetical protein